MIGRLISESIFSSQSSREKRAEFDGVMRLVQKIWPKKLWAFFMCKLVKGLGPNLSINSHTGYMNVHAKN